MWVIMMIFTQLRNLEQVVIWVLGNKGNIKILQPNVGKYPALITEEFFVLELA